MECLIEVGGMIQRQDPVVENAIRNNAENTRVTYVSSKPCPVILSSLWARLPEEWQKQRKFKEKQCKF